MAYPRERVYWIPEGHAGIEATVRTMRQLARDGTTSPLLRSTADRILAGAGTDADRARRIRDFLQEWTRFEFDPPGVELVRTPHEMLDTVRDGRAVSGDCDDVAVLGAALSHVAGLRSRFVLLGFEPGAPFRHVYTEVLADGRWRELDVTRPAQFPPGLRIHRRGFRET